MCIHIYIYIYIYMSTETSTGQSPLFGRGEDTVGNPHRAQIYQFELFELILLLKLDKRFSIEQFEPRASQSTVPCPPPGYTLRPDF